MIAHWHSNLCSATRIRIYAYKLLSLRSLAFPFLKEWFRFYRYIVIFNAWINENVMTQNTYKTSESLSLVEIEIFQRDATIPKRQFPRCFLCREIFVISRWNKNFTGHVLFASSFRTIAFLDASKSKKRSKRRTDQIAKYYQNIIEYNSTKRYLTERCLLKSRAKSINS